MEDRTRDDLARRFAAQEWRGHNSLSGTLLVQNFDPEEDVLPGWRKERQRRVPIGRRAVHTIWSRQRDGVTQRIRLDWRETDSRLNAHDDLQLVLGDYQAPQLERRAHDDIGDVAFSPPGGRSITFARANLVFFLADLGPGEVDIEAIARRIDERLTTLPAGAQSAAGRRRGARAPAPVLRVAPGAEEDLGVEVDSDSDEAREVRVFAPRGELALVDGRIVLRAGEKDEPGESTVSVYTHGRDGIEEHSLRVRTD